MSPPERRRRQPHAHQAPRRVDAPIVEPAPWTPEDLPVDDPGKWVPCTRCRHLRLEHDPAGVRCDVRLDTDRPNARCACAGFDNYRPRGAKA